VFDHVSLAQGPTELADVPMSTELDRQIRRLHYGDHCCHIYETVAEQQAAMVPFFRDGLARGEQCLCQVDDRIVDDVKGALAAGGIDVAAESDRGALRFLTQQEMYLKDGEFHPQGAIDQFREWLREALGDSFLGLRATSEMSGVLCAKKAGDRVVEYEALLNDFFAGEPIIAICQYHQGHSPTGVTLDVLRTHTYALLGEEVCPNVYFEPIEMVLGRAPDASRLAWRLKQLRQARESAAELERAVRARETFLAVAGHELRTPVTALQLRLQTMLKTAASEAPQSRVASGLRFALDQTYRLGDLSERLLDVTLLRSRGLDLSRVRVDLASVVGEAVARHEGAAAKTHCELNQDLRPVEGFWDRPRIEQIVHNLLTNAFQYGAGKPVHVAVGPRGPRSEMAVLTVRDEGIGIAPDDQPRIFGPFQRAVSESSYSGFGVGLWVVQQIAEAHGGSVRVESAPDLGATFTVWLPREVSDGSSQPG
jgi:signal transduction histidine kinase